MPYNPTPADPSAQEGAFDPDEQPTKHTDYPADEAPNQRRAPPQPDPGVSPPQPGGQLPTEQANYPSSQPGGYPAPQQPGFTSPQQPGFPTPQQESYPPTQQANYPPAQQRTYPAGQPASSFYPQQGGYQPAQQGSAAPTQQAGYPPAQQGYSAPPGANVAPRSRQQQPAAAQPGGANPLPYSQYVYPQQAQPAAGATGAPEPAAGRGAQKFWGELSLLGQVGGVAGLLLLIFFFLPWSFTPDISTAITQPTGNIPTINHSGWSTAVGLPLNGGNIRFDLFPHLWLILVSALALIAVAVLLGLHRIGLRLAAILITAISLLALLLEILFLVQINSLQGAINAQVGGGLNQTLYGASWGFWIALVATIVALGIGAYMLYQEYVPGARRTPQAPRFPGGQQPYPTG